MGMYRCNYVLGQNSQPMTGPTPPATPVPAGIGDLLRGPMVWLAGGAAIGYFMGDAKSALLGAALGYGAHYLTQGGTALPLPAPEDGEQVDEF